MGEVNPCIRCGFLPMRRKLGSMSMVRCSRRPIGCGFYVYAPSFEAATEMWNKSNPASQPTPQRGEGT